MLDGGIAVIRFQVLLRYVSRMLCPVNQYVVPGLVLRRTRSGDCLVPLFGRLKIRINIHDYAAILKKPVMNQIANSESCPADIGDCSHILFCSVSPNRSFDMVTDLGLSEC